MAKILVKNSVTSGSAPAGLSLGEMAINITDKKIFIGNAVESAVTVYDPNNHVLSFNGLTGAVGITAGSNITITQSGLTLTISSTSGGSGVTGATGATGSLPTDYVISINGVTGAITNVARTNEGNTFSVRQVMNAGITSAGLYITSGSTFDSTIAATSTTNTIDVIASTDGAGLRIAQATTGSSARVGGIRLGRGASPSANVYLEGYVGTFRVYNGISGTVAPTGTKMLELSPSAGAIFGIPIAGATFSSTDGRISVQKSSYVGSDSGTVRIVGADALSTQYNSDIRANADAAADTTHTLPAVSGTLLNTASSYVSGVNGITGPVGIAAGSNITISASGKTLTIASSAAGGSGGVSEAFVIAMAIAL
jgi:collagen type VII alpha